MTSLLPTVDPQARILTISDYADPPPFWVRRLAAIIPSFSHVTLAPEQPGRRNLWAAAFDDHVRLADGPILLLAYGAACHAAQWWAALSPRHYVERIAAAAFVRPTDHGASEEYAAPNTRPAFPVVVVDDAKDDARDAVRSRRFSRRFRHNFLDLAHPDLTALTHSLGRGGREQLLFEVLAAITIEPESAVVEPVNTRAVMPVGAFQSREGRPTRLTG